MVKIERLYIEHMISEKTKNEYNALRVDYLTEDNEYVTQNVTFDNNVLLVLADLSPSVFAKKLKEVGDYIELKLI